MMSSLAQFLAEAAEASPDGPVLIDHYLEDAFEIDVDAIGDGERIVIAGVMQHIEEAGVHSGDSACVLPPYKISLYHLNIIQDYTEKLGLALHVKGLDECPVRHQRRHRLRAGSESARVAHRAVCQQSHRRVDREDRRASDGRSAVEPSWVSRDMPQVDGFFVKEVVLPFKKFPGVDHRLGPEMRSTGEVMGHAAHFGHAFAKAQMAAGTPLPQSGAALITVNDFDKGAALKIARDLQRLGFTLYATSGTAAWLARAGLPVTAVKKVSEGHPNIQDMVERANCN